MAEGIFTMKEAREKGFPISENARRAITGGTKHTGKYMEAAE